MRGTITQHENRDPHLDLVRAVTTLAIEDAKRGHGDAWHYLWTVAPDLAARLWDDCGHTVPDGDVVRAVEDHEMDNSGRRRAVKQQQRRRRARLVKT